VRAAVGGDAGGLVLPPGRLAAGGRPPLPSTGAAEGAEPRALVLEIGSEELPPDGRHQRHAAGRQGGTPFSLISHRILAPQSCSITPCLLSTCCQDRGGCSGSAHAACPLVLALVQCAHEPSCVSAIGVHWRFGFKASPASQLLSAGPLATADAPADGASAAGHLQVHQLLRARQPKCRAPSLRVRVCSWATQCALCCSASGWAMGRSGRRHAPAHRSPGGCAGDSAAGPQRRAQGSAGSQGVRRRGETQQGMPQKRQET